jgi:F-type H+-transporting ATPase subunit gamma
MAGERRKRNSAVILRLDLEHHRNSLGEIRDIMNSMKTLAYIETRKLARFLDAQHAVVQSIEEVAADFLSFHADSLPEATETIPAYLLIGTERGFCGDFNQALVNHFETALDTQPDGKPILIAVGRKLHTLLENNARVAALIDGASVAEEVTNVLNQMVCELSSLQEQHGMLTVYGLYHSENDGIVTQKLLPPFQQYLHQPPFFPHSPVLHLSPRQFLFALTEQYLFAALHAMLYTSLMAESHSRITHLEGAVKHLDDKSDELARQCSALRQEEIIEEIEVILLSAGTLDKSLPEQNPASSKNSK